MIIDPTIVTAIIATGILGFGVAALTEMLKRLLNATGVGAYICSLVVSAGATAYYLASTNIFTVVAFVVYTILVFLTANGFYKLVVKAPQGL
jgi:hypothetical protein